MSESNITIKIQNVKTDTETNRNIEKFISDNRQSEIVLDLFAANETRDRAKAKLEILLKGIRKCIEYQEAIEGCNRNIRSFSMGIKACKQRKADYKYSLKQLRDGYVTIAEYSLFSEEGLDV